MLIDEIKIYISSGKGGDGMVSFNKNMMELGPTGGSGGKGGDVIAEGVSDIGALKAFRFKKKIYAKDGENGLSQFRDGKDGEDLFLRVPVGTVMENLATGEVKEIKKIGERVLILKGGRGGKGNFHFRSSRNTSPKKSEKGKEGDSAEFYFQLKLIADVGFIGLPNVGKSSLLNELTNSKSKVANYAFTTLEPNLGAYYELIIADIPGLIAGAHKGRGLGVKFLKHIERTKTLFHFISANTENPIEDYNTVYGELKKHNKKLLEKDEYIIISKKDDVSKEKLKKIEKEVKKIGKEFCTISILEEESLKSIKRILASISKEKRK